MGSHTFHGTPIIVVGSGRCGSTLLSRMLAAHPALLVLSELLYATGANDRDALDPWTWNAFVGRLRDPRQPHTFMYSQRLEPSEYLYDVESSRRYSRATGVPPACIATLPSLVPDPDELLDEISALCGPPEPSSFGSMVEFLGGWLAAKLNRKTWVERSGGSLAYVDRLAMWFPSARFVLITRDGTACAESMRAHAAYKIQYLGAFARSQVGFDPFMEPGRSLERDQLSRLPAWMQQLLPQTFDRGAFLDLQLPIDHFCGQWAVVTAKGIATLRELDPSALHHLTYEELVTKPESALRDLAQFCELPDDSRWAQTAASLVDYRHRANACEADHTHLVTRTQEMLGAWLASRSSTAPEGVAHAHD